MRLRFLIASIVLLWSFSAFADKVPPPPPDCPKGSVGDTGHEGPHCVPLDCKVDSDCKSDMTCQKISLCIEQKMIAAGRSETPNKYFFVNGTCEDPSTCESPASCKGGKRCVKSPAGTKAPETTQAPETTKEPENTKTSEASKTPTSTPPAKAGNCSVSSPGSSEGFFWLLLGFIWLSRRSNTRASIR
jgi:hypothetical protein